MTQDTATTERDRLIKLLEDHQAECSEPEDDRDQGYDQGLANAILILKGQWGKSPCVVCATLIDSDVHAEELGMCVECSNAYYTHPEE